MDVIQTVDIQTRLPRLVLAQFLQQFSVLLQIGHDMERQVPLAGRETNEARVAFVSTGVGVVIAPEANDTATPHLGFSPSDLLHKFDEGEAILALLLVGNAFQETVNAAVILFSLEFSHVDLLPE